jgi:N,N'-diacetyllegionaminate synthase
MVYVIAEAGSNYNGSVELALQLNSAAAAAGADCVKYQLISPYGLYLEGDYSYGNYKIEEVIKIRELNTLSDQQWYQIKDHAESLGLDFSFSLFDERGITLASEMGIKFAKVASTDLNNHMFLRKLARAFSHIVISTGMSTLIEIEDSLNVLRETGDTNLNLVVMHCVSSYPVPTAKTNLAFLPKLQSFGHVSGFSDHSLGVEAAAGAVALGAVWIEKHFTLDRDLPGLDHEHSLNPEELRQFINALRSLEESLNYSGEKLQPEEVTTMARARRGVYAKANLPKGHVVTEEDLNIVRPPSEISADKAEDLLGKKLLTELKKDDPFPKSLLS